ncbi:MAG: family 16 glycosylhydrolase [Ginsengibacter sp.]
MKFLKNTIATGLLFLMITSCKKGESKPAEAPSNLAITTHVSTDGSGTVNFTATADNAVSYLFDFGNGEAKTATTGNLTYTYTAEGYTSYTVTVTATGSGGQTTKKSFTVSVYIKPAVPTLLWSDEFNTDGPPDPAKWGYDIGTGGNGWGNNELEYYTNRPENSIVQNGVLKIKAIKESYSGSGYTSARILSQNKFAFTYGTVEFRAKLPAGVGTWPALWTLGSNVSTVGWPACGEMDVMEMIGRDLNKIFGTLHYPGRSGGNADGSTTVISNASTQFHTYSMEWTPSIIKISVDSMVYHTVVNTTSLPFNHDFFLIMNIAIGGNFGGDVDPAFVSDSMEVDYVRVYK